MGCRPPGVCPLPRRSRRRCSDWQYLDASRASAPRAARRRRGAVQAGTLARRPTICRRTCALAEALFEAGKLDESQRLLRVAGRRAARGASRRRSGSAASPRRKGRHDRRHPALAARDRALPRIRRRLLRARAVLSRARTDGRGAARARAARAVRRALARARRSGARRRRRAERRRGRSLRRGVKLADAGDLAGAIAAHEAALARDPSLVAGAREPDLALRARGDSSPKAEEHYRAAVALGADLSEAHYDYGVLLGLQEKWDLAADAYRKAIALNPPNVQARQQPRAGARASAPVRGGGRANTARPLRASRRSGWPASISGACCWRSDEMRKPSPS